MMEDIADEFTCGACQEKFYTLTLFLQHKIGHVDTKNPGGCPLCGMAFSRQVSLREHLHRKHNIPKLKPDSTNGKQRGRPRKNFFVKTEEAGGGNTDTSIAAGNHAGDSSAEKVADKTMHIIIDKIGDSNLGTSGLHDTILQSDDPVTFPSSSAKLEAETSDNAVNTHLGHLVEGTGFESPSQVLQTQSPHILQHHSGPSQIVEEHEETQSLRKEMVCNNTESISLPAPGRSVSLRAKSSAVSGVEEETDLDFFFILMSNHVKRKSFSYNRQSFKCFHCEYKTSWRRSLVKHMRDNHSDHLAVHQCITVHNSEKLQDQQVMRMTDYLAMLERQRRQTNGQRARGVEKQDMPGYFPCAKCNKVFGRLRYLRKHQVTHRADKRFLCDDCGKAFKTKSYLAAHRQTHQTKVYQCRQCPFSSAVSSLVHSHRQIHNDHSVICEVCGSAYNDRATLRKHSQVHDKSRPFPCLYPGCTWRFKSEVMCRAHFRGHTTAGRFVCNLCSYVFRHKHHLQRHLGKIHGMDEATIYRTTCGASKAHPHVNPEAQPSQPSVAPQEEAEKTGEMLAVGEAEGYERKELLEVVQEAEHPLTDTVNLIVNSALSSEQLQCVLESGQFVIATDEDEGAVNYQVSNITMNVDYDQLATGDGVVTQGQTILIPHDAECSQIVFHQEVETEPDSIKS